MAGFSLRLPPSTTIKMKGTSSLLFKHQADWMSSLREIDPARKARNNHLITFPNSLAFPAFPASPIQLSGLSGLSRLSGLFGLFGLSRLSRLFGLFGWFGLSRLLDSFTTSPPRYLTPNFSLSTFHLSLPHPSRLTIPSSPQTT